MGLKAAGLFFSACWFWLRDQFCEFSEVLGGSCELELFVCAFGSSEPHHPNADVSLQMSKEHLDFSPLDERGHVGIGFAYFAGDVSSRFVDGSHHASARVTRTALRLERACVAIMFRGAVSDEPILSAVGFSRLGEVPAVCSQLLVAGACVAVGRGIVDKILA